MSVAGEEVSAIGPGLLCLLGVLAGDTSQEAMRLAQKTLGLRIFPDRQKPMNRSVVEVGGALLVVSQFTLAANTSRGMRPSFTRAAAPELAERLYVQYVEALRRSNLHVGKGVFGAQMMVSLENDGPVTILLET